MQIQKSYMAPQNYKKQWYLFDGENQILGRLAAKIAMILMGKHRPTYTPHIDAGDFIIVTNVTKVKVTGKKLKDKMYYSWTGYPGGLRKKSLEELNEKHPEAALMLAVRRMLPKSKMGRQMLTKLKIYEGATHPHAAQAPQVWKDTQE